MRITDQLFVVTGAGNGIGREVASQLLDRGARVAALDLRAESLAETARLCGSGAGSGRLWTYAVDVADPEAVGATVTGILADCGPVDGLVNVAGVIQPFVRFAELDLAAMHHVMDVNFWGVVHTTSALLPHLQARPQACVVNVSSMGGFTPAPGQAVYGASKAAVKLLTEALYAECRGTSVAVTVVFPGGVATDIAGNSGVSVGAGAAEEAGKGFPMTSVRDAGRAVVEAVARGPYRVLIGKDASLLDRFSRLSPRRATEMIASKMASLIG